MTGELHREHYSAIVSINYLLAYVYPTTDPPPKKKWEWLGNNSIGCLTYFIVNEGIPYTKIKFRNENDDQPEKTALLKQIISKETSVIKNCKIVR